MVHAFNHCIQEAGQANVCEYEATLIYTESFTPARASYIVETDQNKTKQNKKYTFFQFLLLTGNTVGRE